MFQSRRLLIAILAAVGLVVVAAVYLIGGPHSNDLGTGPGRGSSSLAALATGPVANFVPAAAPAPVPNLEFKDGEGKTVRLADFRGKLVLLNLWATWCTPCREEMPSLDALEGAIGSDRFQVVALSVDQNGLELARAFLKEVKVSHLALYNDPTSRSNFQMKGYGLPTTVLVSPEGLELGRIVGPAEWNTPEAKALIAAALKLPSGR